ncbi:transposase [Candidatus Nomurabacteria bacterium]|nr:transposase [Candidatus Nomurabacteria bacterium]
MFTLASYALFKDYKRNSLDAMAMATHTGYQKFQYFFSDSAWDIQSLKRKRLEIVQKQRTTAFTKGGLLAINDTGCPKPFAKKTEGARWQYCGPLKMGRSLQCRCRYRLCLTSKTFSPRHRPLPSRQQISRWRNQSPL